MPQTKLLGSQKVSLEVVVRGQLICLVQEVAYGNEANSLNFDVDLNPFV